MEIKKLVLGDISVNCYLLSTNNAAVVIDPGYYSNEVLNFLKEANKKERIILLTHCHFDHIGFAEELSKQTDTKIAIGEKDAFALSDNYVNLSQPFGVPLNPFNADILLTDSQKFSVSDITFEIIHTPGHTVGGVCYKCDDIVFSGDTLFESSIGRTDFPGGDFKTLEKSVKMLYTLPDDTILLSGHGNKTNIKNERLYNPFIRG